MPICIECRQPVTQLYTSYSRADDSSLGRGVRLTQCPRCRLFADKYVEHDFVVLFIDLVLVKPQVYRHLLFNRLGRDDDRFDRSIVRLAVLLLLFDVYLTWARIEKTIPASTSLTSQPVLVQYLFFLALCTLETLAFHLPIRLLASVVGGQDVSSPSATPSPTASSIQPVKSLLARYLQSIKLLLRPRRAQGSSVPAATAGPGTMTTSRGYTQPNRISTALLVSSCTKLFPILMVIWEYDLPSSASAVSWAVIINNVAALEILLDCGWGRATALATLGAACRWFVGWWLLRTVGLTKTLDGLTALHGILHGNFAIPNIEL